MFIGLLGYAASLSVYFPLAWVHSDWLMPRDAALRAQGTLNLTAVREEARAQAIAEGGWMQAMGMPLLDTGIFALGLLFSAITFVLTSNLILGSGALILLGLLISSLCKQLLLWCGKLPKNQKFSPTRTRRSGRTPSARHPLPPSLVGVRTTLYAFCAVTCMLSLGVSSFFVPVLITWCEEFYFRILEYDSLHGGWLRLVAPSVRDFILSAARLIRSMGTLWWLQAGVPLGVVYGTFRTVMGQRDLRRIYPLVYDRLSREGAGSVSTTQASSHCHPMCRLLSPSLVSFISLSLSLSRSGAKTSTDVPLMSCS